MCAWTMLNLPSIVGLSKFHIDLSSLSLHSQFPQFLNPKYFTIKSILSKERSRLTILSLFMSKQNTHKWMTCTDPTQFYTLRTILLIILHFQQEHRMLGKLNNSMIFLRISVILKDREAQKVWK